MGLIKYILSQLTIGEYRGFISYSGPLATCYRCGEHVAILSAQDRTKDDDASDCKAKLGATGRKGYSGEG